MPISLCARMISSRALLFFPSFSLYFSILLFLGGKEKMDSQFPEHNLFADKHIPSALQPIGYSANSWGWAAAFEMFMMVVLFLFQKQWDTVGHFWVAIFFSPSFEKPLLANIFFSVKLTAINYKECLSSATVWSFRQECMYCHQVLAFYLIWILNCKVYKE